MCACECVCVLNVFQGQGCRVLGGGVGTRNAREGAPRVSTSIYRDASMRCWESTRSGRVLYQCRTYILAANKENDESCNDLE